MDCNEISADCPVEDTIYGYYPNFGVNVFFTVAFAIGLIMQSAQALKWKTWSYGVSLTFGCLFEVIGYIGRVLLSRNPYSSIGFQLQISFLIIAPAFLSAGIYLTLKHMILTLDPSLSILPPNLYTWIFILCDVLSLISQAAGGAVAATAHANKMRQDAGGHIMLAGIVWQVFTLVVFALAAGQFFWQFHRQKESRKVRIPTMRAKFMWFCWSTVIAFIAIFIRCVYRIAEMQGGWKSAVMRNELDFIIFDGVMVLIATMFLTLFHPGYFLPRMGSKQREQHTHESLTSENGILAIIL